MAISQNSRDSLRSPTPTLRTSAPGGYQMRNPPGNRLEVLKGDLSKQYSIRVQSQWRICFVWDKGNVVDVEIVDYH